MPKKTARKKKTIAVIDAELFRQKLKLKDLEIRGKVLEKYKALPSAKQLREHSAKLLGAGALTGTLLLTGPTDINQLTTPKSIVQVHEPEAIKESFTDRIHKLLPDQVRPLEREEEKSLEQVFNEVLGIGAKATLEGEHLNQTYGLIGAEQHLLRYPGDSVAQHAPTEEQYGGDRPQEILKEGIAPGLGAWGYFAPSKSALSEDLEKTEQWYAVVQTLYLPDWGTRQPYLRDWYKYRKVLIVNTDNGKAVVASIADAGPAAWTGKHFGGSPEVMDYLGGPRYKKGPVVLFFVDDPDNTVPLGPVRYND